MSEFIFQILGTNQTLAGGCVIHHQDISQVARIWIPFFGTNIKWSQHPLSQTNYRCIPWILCQSKCMTPQKKFFFAWNWWNTSQWHPITWIWPLECSRKSQFWRSLKWHSLCTVKVASKNCLSGLHFLELWLVSYHFGNLQSRPSKAH